MSDKPENQEYIGDGVYIEDDGWGFWLKTERHSEPPTTTHRIYLEPDVLKSLMEWIGRRRGK